MSNIAISQFIGVWMIVVKNKENSSEIIQNLLIMSFNFTCA